MKSPHRIIPWYIFTILLVTLGLFVSLLKQGSDPNPGMFLGYSRSRLAFLSVILVLNFTLIGLLIKSVKDRVWREKIENDLLNILKNETIYFYSIISVVVGAFFVILIYQIGSSIQDSYIQGYFEKIALLLKWGLTCLVVTLIFIRVCRLGLSFPEFESEEKKYIKGGFVVFGLFIGLLFLMISTGLGLKPDIFGWGDPGSPITPFQVYLVTIIGFTILMLDDLPNPFIRKIRGCKNRDILVFLALWGITIWAWNSIPLQPSYFAPITRPPNFEYYPYSDAANYDVSANKLLIGNGFGSDIRRPMYSFFLAAAQYFNGNDYKSIIGTQLPVLALIPPLLFLLAKEFHFRITGIMVAFLAIFHQSNAIALSGIINVSHAKLLMSDLPTTLGIIAFTLTIVLWIRNSKESYALLAGGFLALTMLIRIQVFILFPGIFVIIWGLFRKKKQQFVRFCILSVMGLIAVLLPWLWRNQQVFGKVSFGEATQESQIGLIGRRYSISSDPKNAETLINESGNQYMIRMLKSAYDFVTKKPGETTQFITSHFLHNQISTLLTLPAKSNISSSMLYLEPTFTRVWQACCSPIAYVDEIPFWGNWNGNIPIKSLINIGINLLIISIGISTAWNRNKTWGLIPIWINIFYTLGNTIVRNSGWRFNLPVDWVGIFYFGIGLTQCMIWIKKFFTSRSIKYLNENGMGVNVNGAINYPVKKIIPITLILFLVSSMIPISERIIKPRYTQEKLEEILTDLYQQSVFQDLEIDMNPQEILMDESIVTSFGRALYPRFYLHGEGEPGSGWSSYSPKDYARLGFYFVGLNMESNFVLAHDKPPVYFPHGADVVVFGCPAEDFIQARAVILIDEDDYTVIHSSKFPRGCNSP